jgi:transposase
MRQQAVKAVRDGQTVQSVAAAYGVNERSVFRWLADFANGGQNALLAKPIPGRPSKLSAEELSWIANAVRDHNPQQFKFEFGLWTLSLIRHLIKRQFKKELSVSSVHRLMKILGFSAQKPLYQAWQQDPVLVRTWETETYPAIRAEAKRLGATIYFWRRVGHPLGLPHRHDLGATRPDAGGAGDGPALLAEHDLGRRHAGRISVHAA